MPDPNWSTLWTLDPGITFLNHGSFGACPKALLEAQSELRALMERQPVHFFARLLPGLLDEARAELARFIDADEAGLVFVTNATTGVNTVLKSLSFRPGDELLTTDHVYGACRNTLEVVAARAGAKVVVAAVPFPTASEEQVIDAILGAVTRNTRLALLDHVTSPTGLVFPVARLTAALEARGVEVLIDGAHAPGMLELSVREIGASYYTGNCHKWLCTPKGSAFLHVREDKRGSIQPLVTSHGVRTDGRGRLRGAPFALEHWRFEHDWPGTFDASAVLAIPHAIRYFGGLLPGGWPALRSEIRRRALAGRDQLLEALGVPAPAPDAMLATLAAVPLPPNPNPTPGGFMDSLHHHLFEEDAIEVVVFSWPAPPARVVRVSAHLYNSPEDYAHLARRLRAHLDAGR